jgi:hypothetical protein
MLVSQENIYSDLIKISKGIYRNVCVPIWLYNKLEECIEFSASSIINNSSLSNRFKVGYLGSFVIFVDMNIPYDQIHFFLDKEVARESKIDFIIESKENIDEVLIAFIDKQ